MSAKKIIFRILLQVVAKMEGSVIEHSLITCGEIVEIT